MGQAVVGLGTSQKKEIAGAPGPPFTADSADNGLSVDTVSGKIVLGNDVADPATPAQLVSDREIVMEDPALTPHTILFNAVQALVTTLFSGDRIVMTGQDFATVLFSMIAGGGSIINAILQGGDSGTIAVRAITGDAGITTIQARTGSGGTSTIEATTADTTGQSIYSLKAGATDQLTIEAGTFNAGRISFRIRGLFETIAINTSTLCTRIMSTETSPFNGATLQVAGSHTYRKFEQSNGAGTLNLDRDQDSAKVIRNSGALTINFPNMAGANFRDGFFIDVLVNNAAGITINAGAGTTIRFGSLATSVNGTISSTDVGAAIRICIIDTTTYYTASFVGVWNLT